MFAEILGGETLGGSNNNGKGDVSVTVREENGDRPPQPASSKSVVWSCFDVPFLQKMIAEVLGTYFVIFAGCASVVVNLNSNKMITFPGISIVWGLVVMVMVYSVGHISGAHFNPAVTIAFATCRRFPWKQVPAYVSCQVLGSTLAAGTLRLIFNGDDDHFAGTAPAGTNLQCFVVEFIITFYLMFVISGVATDNRAIGELAGLAVGSTVLLNVMFAGPITGASMNPARSIGPAIVSNHYNSLWVYILAPITGAVSGALVYNLIRFTDKPLREITKSGSFLKAKISDAIIPPASTTNSAWQGMALKLRSSVIWSSTLFYTIWAIWAQRNKRVFEGLRQPWHEVADYIKRAVLEWNRHDVHLPAHVFLSSRILFQLLFV